MIVSTSCIVVSYDNNEGTINNTWVCCVVTLPAQTPHDTGLLTLNTHSHPPRVMGKIIIQIIIVYFLLYGCGHVNRAVKYQIYLLKIRLFLIPSDCLFELQHIWSVFLLTSV